MNAPARLRKIEAKLNTKQINKRLIWPIYGGLSTDPSPQVRNVTPQEVEILLSKRLSAPLCIALNREKEFLKYLESK